MRDSTVSFDQVGIAISRFPCDAQIPRLRSFLNNQCGIGLRHCACVLMLMFVTYENHGRTFPVGFQHSNKTRPHDAGGKRQWIARSHLPS